MTMTKEDAKKRMQEIADRLNEASRAYYQTAVEIIPNIEYDALYDELLDLEKEFGILIEDSPSQSVGYEIISDLPKEEHEVRMLSLDKTKSKDELAAFLGDHEGLLAWKLDGITIVLTYDNGKLSKAVTRGNGDVGEVVTANALYFDNLPAEIAYKGHLILRGEAVITYSDFEKINANIPDADSKYKNARNLCSGSIRQLDPTVTKGRHVRFYAFSLIGAEDVDFRNSFKYQMEWLVDQGFQVADYKMVTQENLKETVDWYAREIMTYDIPSDGLVLGFEDLAYGESLGVTAKFPRNAMAFKWADETKETTLREIEWSASRTGLINPIAVFDPLELEGTTVSRASVHNISTMQELKLGIGDRITVYKSNMIIPQIKDNLTQSDNIYIPEECPVCGSDTLIREDKGVVTLFCPNPDCLAKHVKSLALFVSRDALDVDGLSEATIEKLIGRGAITDFGDLFRLKDYKEMVIDMEGFGEKSFDNLVASIEAAKRTTPERLLYGLGIPGIGTANARLIARACHNSWAKIQSLTKEELVAIDGIGDVMADDYVRYFRITKNRETVEDLLGFLDLDQTETARDDYFDGLTFVITGSLNNYANREQLVAEIEKAGGSVAGSVSGNTSYLINNDASSGSAKNRKAAELGIPVIDEDTVMKWMKDKAVTE